VRTCVPLPQPCSATHPRREPSSLPIPTSPHPPPRTPSSTTPTSSPPSPESAMPANRSTQVPIAPTHRGRAGSCTRGSCALACRSRGASARSSSTSTPVPASWATPGALRTASGRGIGALPRARCYPATRGRGLPMTSSTHFGASGACSVAGRTSLPLRSSCRRVRGWASSTTAGRCIATCSRAGSAPVPSVKRRLWIRMPNVARSLMLGGCSMGLLARTPYVGQA
jgi:hypothetical protein